MITYDSIAAMRLNRYIFGINSQLDTVDKQLKTGSTINKASDDPVVFNFTARVKGYSELYSKANENVQNGITIVDTASDAISQMQKKLKEIRKLVEKGSESGVSQEERKIMQKDIDKLIKEIYTIKQNTGFTALDGYGGIQILEEARVYAENTSAVLTTPITVENEEISPYIIPVTPKSDEELYAEDYDFVVHNADELIRALEDDPDNAIALGADIDLSGIDWEPYGRTARTAFAGIFNGNGYKITNLTIDSGTESNVGFFGYTNGATLINVALEDVNVTGGINVGALAGEAENTTIENSYVTSGTVTGGSNIGGLVGFNYNSAIKASYTELDLVKASTKSSGGLVGASETSTIERSYSKSNIETGSYGGGLVGDNSNTSITNSYSAGTVKGNYIGGFVGQNQASPITNSYTSAMTTCTASSDQIVGAFIGNLHGYDNNAVENSFFDFEATTQTEPVGRYQDSTRAQVATLYSKSTEQMKTSQTFVDANWDENIWILNDDYYPMLKAEAQEPFPDKPEEPTYYGPLKLPNSPIRIQTGNNPNIYVDINTAFSFDDNFNFWVTSQAFSKQSLLNLEKVEEQLEQKKYDISLQKIQLNSENISTATKVQKANNVLNALTGVDEEKLQAQKNQLLSDLANAKSLRAATLNLNADMCKTLVLGAVYGSKSSEWLNSLLIS